MITLLKNAARFAARSPGGFLIRFRQPFRDGTTQVVLDPLELIAHTHVRHPTGDL